MAKSPSNPFYILLVIVGIVFAVTACAYGVMTIKLSTAAGASASSGEWLVDFLNRYGMWLLLGELAVLAVLTFAAIGTDDYWTRRHKKDSSQEPPHDA